VEVDLPQLLLEPASLGRLSLLVVLVLRLLVYRI